MNNNILGFFISYSSLHYDATLEMKNLSKEQGDLFSAYIWGEQGVDNALQQLKQEHYGKDLIIILFQFYIKPIPYLLQNLKSIEKYRKDEKSIGIPIVVTDENFFNKSEVERFIFLKQSILQKLDLLAELINKKRLDTNIELLKVDVVKMLV